MLRLAYFYKKGALRSFAAPSTKVTNADKVCFRCTRPNGCFGIPLTRMDIRFDDFAIIFILKNRTLTAWTFDTLIAL